MWAEVAALSGPRRQHCRQGAGAATPTVRQVLPTLLAARGSRAALTADAPARALRRGPRPAEDRGSRHPNPGHARRQSGAAQTLSRHRPSDALQGKTWRERAVTQLANDLRRAFPDMKGLSRVNICNMRRATSTRSGRSPGRPESASRRSRTQPHRQRPRSKARRAISRAYIPPSPRSTRSAGFASSSPAPDAG